MNTNVSREIEHNQQTENLLDKNWLRFSVKVQKIDCVFQIPVDIFNLPFPCIDTKDRFFVQFHIGTYEAYPVLAIVSLSGIYQLCRDLIPIKI